MCALGRPLQHRKTRKQSVCSELLSGWSVGFRDSGAASSLFIWFIVSKLKFLCNIQY